MSGGVSENAGILPLLSAFQPSVGRKNGRFNHAAIARPPAGCYSEHVATTEFEEERICLWVHRSTHTENGWS